MNITRGASGIVAGIVGMLSVAGCSQPDLPEQVQASVDVDGTQEKALCTTCDTGGDITLTCSGTKPYVNVDRTACVAMCASGQELYANRCYWSCPADTFQIGSTCYPDGYAGTTKCDIVTPTMPIRRGDRCCNSANTMCTVFGPLSGFSLSVPTCYYPYPYFVCNAWGSCWCQSTKPY